MKEQGNDGLIWNINGPFLLGISGTYTKIVDTVNLYNQDVYKRQYRFHAFRPLHLFHHGFLVCGVHFRPTRKSLCENWGSVFYPLVQPVTLLDWGIEMCIRDSIYILRKIPSRFPSTDEAETGIIRRNPKPILRF